MRSVPLLAACALLAAAPSWVQAVDVRFVTVAEAEVRAGPSADAKFYITNKLPGGSRVEVLEELPDGWLKIAPPAGSFSWINTRYIKQLASNQPNHVVVHVDDVQVPVYIGSNIVNQPPTVTGTKLKTGFLIERIGTQTFVSEDGILMPIKAPLGEGRFIRAEMVGKNAPGSAVPATLASVNGGGQRTTSSFSPANPPASAAPHASPEAMWYQALQAERTGRYQEAVRLYALVGADCAVSNPYMSGQALYRAKYLQDYFRSYGVALPPGPTTTDPRQGVASVAPTARLGAPGPERSSFTRETTAPATLVSRFNPTNPSTYSGLLRESGRCRDGRKLYALDSPGYPRMYVTVGEGVDLERHIDRSVQLTGPAHYDGELRANFMTVQRVQALP
jgi:hypothetical protein